MTAEDRVVPEAEALVASFAAWMAGERASGAAASRARERWLRQQAEEGATWLGALVDLCEARAEVTLDVGSRTLAGQIVAVGRDLCVLAEPGRGPTIVAVAHIVAARSIGVAVRPASGDRAPALPVDLAGALASLAADRGTVRLVLTGGERVTGTLIGAGVDVVSLRSPGAGATVHVPLRAVETCGLAG